MKYFVIFLVLVVLVVGINESFAQYFGDIESQEFFISHGGQQEIRLQSSTTKFNDVFYDESANAIIIYTDSSNTFTDIISIHMDYSSFKTLLADSKDAEPSDALVLLDGEEQEYETPLITNGNVVWQFKNKPNVAEIELILKPERYQDNDKQTFEKTYSITEKQVRYVIPYTITNGTIDDMRLYCHNAILALDVSSEYAGTIQLDIPISMLGAIFMVTINEEEWDDISLDKNVLTIHFPENPDSIYVQGAYLNSVNRDGVCDVVHDPPYSYIIPPLKQFNMGRDIDSIQCKENLVVVQKFGGYPACVQTETKAKLIERGWVADPAKIHEITQRIEYNPHTTLEVSPKDAKFIEQLALQRSSVANFVSEIDWKSECCKDTFMVETQEYEISITIQRLDQDNHLRVIFDRDTLEIMDVTNDRYIRHTPITPELGKSGTYELEKNGTEFDIKYHIKGGSDIQEIIPDTNANKLNIILEPYDSGSLEITLPRELIDAKISETVDDLFFVLLDGKEIPYEETTNEISRTLTIQFDKHSQVIEIIGAMPL